MNKKIDTLKTYMSTRPEKVKTIEEKIFDHVGSVPLTITGRNHFNWWLAIKYMEKNPGAKVFSRKLEELASNWVTCACGNQCYIIPRNWHGEPKDNRLFAAGKSFYEAVQRADWKGAKICLSVIEELSADIIKKELEKLNKTL